MFLRRPISFVLGGVGVVSVLAWGVVKDLVPERKTLTPARREAMRAATDEILKTCPRPTGGIVRLAVAPIAGDFTGEVTQHLRSVLDKEGFFNVAPPLAADRARSEINVEQREAGDLETAVAVARSSNAQWVMWGRISRLSEQGNEVAMDMELAINDVSSKASVWSNQVRWKRSNLAGLTQAAGQYVSGRGLGAVVIRLLACLVFFVCFSLVATPVIRAVVDRESNRLNFALLASLTTIDVAAALAILYHSVATFFYIVVIGLLAIAAAWYNYWMCDRLEKNR